MARIFHEFLGVVSRERRWRDLMQRRLDRGHFYDMSEVPADTWMAGGVDTWLVKLPSSVTIIELRVPYQIPAAMEQDTLLVLSEEPGDQILAQLVAYVPDMRRGYSVFGLGPCIRLRADGEGVTTWKEPYPWGGVELTDELEDQTMVLISWALNMINRNRTTVVHRLWPAEQRQHVRGFRGAYWNGYNEILIHDRTVIKGPSRPSGFKKAEEYVSGHERFYKRTGKRVWIKGHYRGDPKLGHHDHRYRVKPPRKPPHSPPPIDRN